MIIDLDETLINSAGVDKNFDTRSLKLIPPQYIREIRSQGDNIKILVVLRPYAIQFLERLSNIYNIYAYSHGRWDYVQRVLDILDRDRKLVRRDVVFKNMGQVGRSTPKMISALGLDQKESDKTIILDDQKYIWEVASKKVLNSKKFIPLKDMMSEDKYLKYMLFTKEDKDGPEKDFIWSLNYKNEPFGLSLYAEYDLVNQQSTQLELLAKLLEDVHERYNFNKLSYPEGHENLQVEKLLENRISNIIKGWKVNIQSLSNTRTKMFKDLVQLLGGTDVEMQDAQYIFVDANLERNQKRLIKHQLDMKPLVVVISADWLIECFLSGSKVSSKAFRAKVSL